MLSREQQQLRLHAAPVRGSTPLCQQCSTPSAALPCRPTSRRSHRTAPRRTALTPAAPARVDAPALRHYVVSDGLEQSLRGGARQHA